MLNSEVINWGTEITIIHHVTFEHMRGTDNILADDISCLGCMSLYDSLNPEGEE